MRRAAIALIPVSALGVDELLLPCPLCDVPCVRTFDMGDQIFGCRACARPSAEAQLAAFRNREARHALP